MKSLVLGLLICAAPVLAAPPPYELLVVAASTDSVPAILNGSSDEEDALNVQICDRLRLGLPMDAIQLKPAELKKHIDELTRDELLREIDGKLTPTFPILHKADAAWFRALDKPAVEATVKAIEAKKKDWEKRFREALQLNEVKARSLSMILFGDVLFDRWQTKNVRNEFLDGYPPARNGKQFYAVGLEKVDGSTASLGIYTHAEPHQGDYWVITYGNKRPQDPLVGLKAGDVQPLLQQGTVMVGKAAYSELPALADLFAPELLQILNADRAKLVAAYRASPYVSAVSFPEFALWWYHFYDAEVVDRLIQDKVIEVPKAGYATLIVRPD
ncbi:MAG TPA: hypothetical protein VH083_22350 [Myxococcales bacterium]|nr:hypothetical protein [Myxococcales bacterium]